MKEALAWTSRTIPEFLNRGMLDIVNEAYKRTPVASESAIQKSLGASVISTRTNSKGRIIRRYSYKPTRLVYLLVNSRRRKAGLKGLTGGDMEKAAKKLIQGSLRARYSLKSGWVNPIKDLIHATGQPISIPNARPVKGKGYVKLAKPGWEPVVEVTYNLSVKKRGNSIIEPRVEIALNQAYQAKTADWIRYVEGKLANKFNA